MLSRNVDECKPLAAGLLHDIAATSSTSSSSTTSDGGDNGFRGLHSSTIRLNVSTLCGIHSVHDFPPVY